VKTIAFTLTLLAAQFHPLTAQVRISEFLAANENGLEDENGDKEDWIEITNSGGTAVDLGGWSLTDNISNLRKWIFPAMSVPAGGTLVVFASGKDRSIPGLQLHTNFSLSKNGEYLALVMGDGTTIATEFSPSFPIQASDVSYGYEQGDTTETVVTLETPGRVGIPTTLSEFNGQFGGWNTDLTATFTGSRWRNATLGIGYETDEVGGTYGNLIGSTGNIEGDMLNLNPSAFIRIPFTVTNTPQITSASLRMRWDDGFVAYLNGQKCASDRAPVSPAWNSLATGPRPDELNDEQIDFPLDLSSTPLNEGLNLLAIQGLNATVDSSDFLVQPQLVLTRARGTTPALVYFSTPTPGAPNTPGEATLAPVFRNVTDSAPRPTGNAGSPPLIVTAEVHAGTHPIQSVKVFYRTMFAAESSLTLLDNGTGADAIAGDSIFSGSIPTSSLAAGKMLRWRYLATDSNGAGRSAPAYPDPNDSDRYYGTVADNPALITSSLPVIETFVQDTAAVDTRGGGRVSMFYLGRFYDNILMDLHGQSSASFPKKSHDLDFNSDNRFKWKEGENKVKDVNLLTNWADKSKVRNQLAYEMYQKVGAGYHFAFPVRIERNGSFFSTADLVEEGDERYTERIGLDPSGALYKIYDTLEDANNSVKKTREDEGNQDLRDFISNIDLSQGSTTLRRKTYDNIDLAATINHLVANQVIGVSDTGYKNFYLYRDTEGSGEWRPLPWDVDLSAGRRYTESDKYFDDRLFSDLTLEEYNPLWEIIYSIPEFKDMFVRRFETMRRELLQSATSPANDWVRNRVIAIEASTNPPGITSDSDLDYSAWGSWGDQMKSLPASARIYNEWLPAHRNVIFGSGMNLYGTSIPVTQPDTPNVIIGALDVNPTSGSQEEEYIQIKNNSGASVDLSGWTLSGAIDYTFPPGTVILAGAGDNSSDYRGSLYVTKNPARFRARTTGPKKGEFRFIQGGYVGQLSARGETIELKNANSTTISSLSYPSQATAGQQFLRVTEIQYHPLDPSASELAVNPALSESDFEYIELMNTGPVALNLAGASFNEGIAFTFPAGTSLAAGGRIIIASNTTAFALRYGSPGVPVLGPFYAQLDNGGERIQLLDPTGENILDFDYEDSWYPPSDGSGPSLVLRDPLVSYNLFDQPASWGSSPEATGSPGSAGGGFLTHFNGWQATNYTLANRQPGMPGHHDSDSDGDGLSTWMEYALGHDPLNHDPAEFPAETSGSGSATHFGIRTDRRPNTSDVVIRLLASTTLAGFDPVSEATESDPQTINSDRESVLMLDAAPVSANHSKFYRLEISSRY
jgi:hypothetical protein